MKLFQFAVIVHPTEKGLENGEQSKVVVDVTAVLAKDEHGAVLEAGRRIPQDVLDTARDRIEVAVRPF